MKNRQEPLITIGIPTFNRGDSYLPESLASALRQTYSNLEIIVSDNCSSDQTEAFVKGFKDGRIQFNRYKSPVLPHENADNCLRRARGDYFLLLHDDDLIDPDFVEVCVQAIGGDEVNFVHTGARTIGADGRVLKERKNEHGNSTSLEYLDAILTGNAVTYFCNTLYNTKALRSIGGFRSGAHMYQDVIATIKLTCLGRRADIGEPKASYRIHDGKLGRVGEIANWCDDSLEMIDAMCQGAPDHENHFRTEGMRLLCLRNYRRAMRVATLSNRMHAYWIVYRRFKRTPFEIFYHRIRKRLARGSPEELPAQLNVHT